MRIVFLVDQYINSLALRSMRSCTERYPGACIAERRYFAKRPGAEELDELTSRWYADGWAVYLVSATTTWMLETVQGLMQALGSGGRHIVWLVVMDKLLDQTWFYQNHTASTVLVITPHVPAELVLQYGLVDAIRVARARDALHTAFYSLHSHSAGACAGFNYSFCFVGDTGLVRIQAEGLRIQQSQNWYMAVPLHPYLEALTGPATVTACDTAPVFTPPALAIAPDTGAPYVIQLLFIQDPLWKGLDFVMAMALVRAFNNNRHNRSVLKGRNFRLGIAFDAGIQPGMALGCIGPTTSDVALTLAAAVDLKYGIPIVSSATADVLANKEVFPMFVRIQPPASKQVCSAGEEMHRRLFAQGGVGRTLLALSSQCHAPWVRLFGAGASVSGRGLFEPPKLR